MAIDPSNVYAFLVGINDYHPQSQVAPLKGCVNDVNSMEQILSERFGVPQSNICKLLNAAATCKAINDDFRACLINKVNAWQAAGGVGEPPAVLFYYSGHGSQSRDLTNTEPDGFDETIVPYDSRTPGVFDIKDWELGQLIDELNKVTDNVTVVLDCCHSGSGTRAADGPPVRWCAPDLREQPTQRPVTLRTRSISSSGWETGSKHALLAGCRDREKSKEYAVPGSDPVQWHGVMSYFLQQNLAQLLDSYIPTCRDLYERVRAAVTTIYADQHPQAEGDIGREFLGGVRPPRESFYSVTAKRDGLVWVDAGKIHGLRPNSLLKVYPLGTQTLADAGPALATLKTVQVGAVESGCSLVSGADPELLARVTVFQLDYGDARRGVLLKIDDAAVHAAVTARLTGAAAAEKDTSSYVHLVTDAPDYRVALNSKTNLLEIQDAGGSVLVKPRAVTDLDGIAGDLAHIVCYRTALELNNDAPFSALNGKVTLAIKLAEKDPITQKIVYKELPRSPGGEAVVEEGARVTFEITNTSTTPVFVGMFGFYPNFHIVKLHPNDNAREAIVRGAPRRIGPPQGSVVKLDSEDAESVETYKIIASVAEADFSRLAQGPLHKKSVAAPGQPPPTRLELLMEQATGNRRGDAPGPTATDVGDDWTTHQIVMRIAAGAPKSVDLGGGVTTELKGYDLSIETPIGCVGKARVFTERQLMQTQSTADVGLQTPAGLIALGAAVRPLVLGSGLSSSAQGDLLEIEFFPGSRQAVTPAMPLRLHLQREAEKNVNGVIALAFDGVVYYPVGQATGSSSVVEIGWLPTYTPPPPIGIAPPTLNSLVRFCLYELVDYTELAPGLHRVRLLTADEAIAPRQPGETSLRTSAGEVRYSPVTANDFSAGQRVALAVHGETGDSAQIAAWLLNELPPGLRYDHVLTFDYDLFGAGIDVHSQDLAALLRAAGIDGALALHLDIFAQGMGGLVARSLVELAGGHRFVKRCFLIGAPNLGVRLAETNKLTQWLLTLLINQASDTPATLVAKWALGKVASGSASVVDLQPRSSFISRLNRSWNPSVVPYFVLAGINQPTPAQTELWSRLRRTVFEGLEPTVDAVFAEQNDLLVNLRSLMRVRNGLYPSRLLTTAVAPCAYFEYATHPAAKQQLLTWLGA